MTSIPNPATIARTYAKSAHAAFSAACERLADLASNRPLDLDTQHHEAFIATRALFTIYNRAILLDDNGNSSYSDDRVIDRLMDARNSNARWLKQSKSLQSGLNQVEAHHAQEAARRFLSDTAFLDTDPVEGEAGQQPATVIVVTGDALHEALLELNASGTVQWQDLNGGEVRLQLPQRSDEDKE
ncbi:hypothetical protein AB0942_28500 [Streptomyces nodosus]|uniref:hypothetical protein n=1 Tax=Streptomyces nodosus TaxID=40318 RepID=UPI003452477B